MAALHPVHGKPSEGLQCMATLDAITEAAGNYCEYQTAPSGKWQPALFAADVVQRLLATQFHTYMQNLQEAYCKVEIRRLLAKGPPVWLEDKYALPLPEGETHVCCVWYAKNGEEESAKLHGALEGGERQALWHDLQQLLEEAEEETEESR
ncbi:hypothetical protein BBJ28_00007837 [Nothophytophthora sp. Chile5]|nr:hypothetical protein BBJ28_00007837 [Nothophytophthora sp. Chile5]